MRVTLINHRYFPFRGGSELYVQRLAEWLAGSGWDAHVLTTDAFDLEYFWDAGKRRVDARETEVVNGVSVSRLRVSHPPASRVLFQGSRRGMGELSRVVHAAAPFRMISGLLPRVCGLHDRLLERPSPDLIIGANLGLESLPLAGMRAAKRLSVPFVLLPFAHLGDDSDAVAKRYVSMPHQRELVRDADLVIALTEIEADFLEEIGIDPFRICVAGAGVDLNEVVGASPVCDDGQRPFTILSVGALAGDKGTMDLVEASMIMHSQGRQHRLVLAGPELSAFTQWFEDSGAIDCDWIERRGFISDEEKAGLFRAADVFALPSRTESFGIVYLEAWANDLPVIGARAGAVTEVVKDGVDGLLAPFGEPHALAEAIARLMDSTELRSSLGAAGRAKVEARFTWDAVLARVSAAFEEVLGVRV